jgi:hypothetical protein
VTEATTRCLRGWGGKRVRRDLGEIDIHPAEPAVIKPLELGRQAGPEAEHLSIGVMLEKVAQQLIQNQTALN